MVLTSTDRVAFLDLQKQHASLKDDLIRVVSDAIDQARFVGGPEVLAFESEFTSYIGTRFSVGVGSGTDALRFALLALGIGPDTRVVTVPNTFIATIEAITQTGAQVDLVDIDEDSCLIDLNQLEDFLKKSFSAPEENRPMAVLPVHLYGQCADMDPINELAKKYELKVIEDAAQAHGARYKDRRAGNLGHAAAFSFYPGKNLGACGEAGMVTTNDPKIADIVSMIRDHGQKVKYHHAIEGYNGRLDAIQAGFLRIKLPHLESWNAKRREIASLYDNAFSEFDWVRPVKIASNNVSCYHLYVIRSKYRDAIQAYFKERNVDTGLHYPIPIHLQECYAHLGYKPGSFPHAEKACNEILSLPIYPELSLEQAKYVINTLREFGERL
jgi:dTDP-4-amino-4,6-dideoxygalactose transaminase